MRTQPVRAKCPECNHISLHGGANGCQVIKTDESVCGCMWGPGVELTMTTLGLVPGQPAPPERTITLAADFRWGTIGRPSDPGSNADPLRDLAMLCDMAPMPVGAFIMSPLTWVEMAERADVTAAFRQDDERCFIALPDGEHEILGRVPMHAGVVLATGRERPDVELARLVGAVQDAATVERWKDPDAWRKL